MKKIAIIIGCLMLLLILMVAFINGKQTDTPIIVESGDSGDSNVSDLDKWLEEFDPKEYLKNNSGEIEESYSETDYALDGYLKYLLMKADNAYTDCRYGFLFLDETQTPYMYDDHKFYHFENGIVKEIQGYLNEREDRTSKYYIKNKPFVLDVYNYMGLQSYTVYKLEEGKFKKLYSSEEYLVNIEDFEGIDATNYKTLDGINQKELDFLINQYLESKDYKEESTLYFGIDDNFSKAVREYKSELRENL